ncbi:MAG: hypothetical protein ACP5NX_03435 [Candidatus Bilamarchaeaceae archaeon]
MLKTSSGKKDASKNSPEKDGFGKNEPMHDGGRKPMRRFGRMMERISGSWYPLIVAVAFTFTSIPIGVLHKEPERLISYGFNNVATCHVENKEAKCDIRPKYEDIQQGMDKHISRLNLDDASVLAVISDVEYLFSNRSMATGGKTALAFYSDPMFKAGKTINVGLEGLDHKGGEMAALLQHEALHAWWDAMPKEDREKFIEDMRAMITLGNMGLDEILGRMEKLGAMTEEPGHERLASWMGWMPHLHECLLTYYAPNKYQPDRDMNEMYAFIGSLRIIPDFMAGYYRPILNDAYLEKAMEKSGLGLQEVELLLETVK